VERAISYYYQRCYDTPACVGYRRAINTLTADELALVIRVHRHMLLDPLDPQAVVVLDEGMSNAACTALSGERRTAGMRVALDRGSFPVPAALTAQAKARALLNVQHCVVGSQEAWESTVQHILHFFPWLHTEVEAERKWQMAPRRMQLFAGQETLHTLLPELRSVIEDANTCDLELYKQVQGQFQRQQQVLDALNFYV
jgi:hypothetical protein